MCSLNAILARYGELAGTMARMVELARERRWEALPGLDAHCTSIVIELRGMQPQELCTLESSRIVALASRIRADQDELSTLVRPQFLHLVRRMAELQQPS